MGAEMSAAEIGSAAALGAGYIANLSGKRISGHKNRKLIRELNQKSMDFQREMWKKNNDYSAWRERMQTAGFNPALAMSGGASPTGVNGSAPNLKVPDNSYPELQGVGQGFIQASDWLRDLEIRRATAKSLHAQGYKNTQEGDVVKPLAEADIGLKKSAEDLNLSRSEYQKLQNQFGPITMRLMNDRAAAETEYYRETAHLNATIQVGTAIHNKWIDDETQQNIAESVARTYDLYKSGDLKSQQVKTEMYKTYNEYYNAIMNRIKAGYSSSVAKVELMILKQNYNKGCRELTGLHLDNAMKSLQVRNYPTDTSVTWFSKIFGNLTNGLGSAALLKGGHKR